MLSQVQIIRSLGDALAWFQQELAWGVQPAELRHLTGRIGELYAAMITQGQMAPSTNQRGYDVVSADNEKISVKTITSSNHVKFRESTFDQVDRVMILKIEVDGSDAAIKEVFDGTAAELRAKCQRNEVSLVYLVRAEAPKAPLENLRVLADVTFFFYRIKQYENGTVVIDRGGQPAGPARPILRKIAAEIGVSRFNSAGNPRNTRQLGAEVIAILQERAGQHPRNINVGEFAT